MKKITKGLLILDSICILGLLSACKQEEVKEERPHCKYYDEEYVFDLFKYRILGRQYIVYDDKNIKYVLDDDNCKMIREVDLNER